VKRVLVTGAGGSAASNFIHSLRLADEPFFIVGTDTSKYHLELADADARYLLPPAGDPAYLGELNRLIEQERIELVHPQPDEEVLALSELREALWARTFLPSHQTVVLCQDKAACARRIAAAGVPAPRFAAADSEASLREGTASILASHEKAWVRSTRGAGARASLPVTSPAQAVSWARYWTEVRGLGYGDFMVSQFLPGREFAFQSLWLDGEIVTSQARERLEYLFGHLTPSGQTSTPSVARTVHRDDVNEVAARSIRAIDPAATGVFCVDLKEDEHGQPLVTEINAGRFFTTSNFLAEAGANMPYHYVRLAFGERLDHLPKVDAVEPGLYWVRMIDMGFKLVREGEWLSRRAGS
jgi:hypothetical protein